MHDYQVYILYSPKLDTFYVGVTSNLVNRLNQHNTAHFTGAFTSKGIPWELFFAIDGLARNQAYAIEKHIKKMKSTKYIVNLKRYPEIVQRLKERKSAFDSRLPGFNPDGYRGKRRSHQKPRTRGAFFMVFSQNRTDE
ncbi:MAG: GIY-YIG nuclease family protein [Cyclobacteriaceae bacterium]|nr:GIY-YIG nuclease family protein [Cyclobacteriaceae bacterium]